MTRKQKRGVLIGGSVAILTLAALLVSYALRKTFAYYVTPSELAEKTLEPGARLRLGGLVADGSLIRGQGTTVSFKITDTLRDVPVTFSGVLPDLFREGQGAVAEGVLESNGVFKADSVLAKHDENYMPPEVKKALEAKGVKLGKTAHQDEMPKSSE